MRDWRVDIHRVGLRWDWSVYHSGYGWAGHVAWTRKRAIRATQRAIAEFVA